MSYASFKLCRQHLYLRVTFWKAASKIIKKQPAPLLKKGSKTFLLGHQNNRELAYELYSYLNVKVVWPEVLAITKRPQCVLNSVLIGLSVVCYCFSGEFLNSEIPGTLPREINCNPKLLQISFNN
jgi:hypothetical protein